MSLVDSILGHGDDEPVPTLDARGDEVFDVIANQRRRYVIRRVARCDENEAVALPDLSVELAEHVEGTPPEEDDDGRVRKRCYVALYQMHLPTLDDQGIVDYDNERGTIAPTDLTEPAARAVTAAERAIADLTDGGDRG